MSDGVGGVRVSDPLGHWVVGTFDGSVFVTSTGDGLFTLLPEFLEFLGYTHTHAHTRTHHTTVKPVLRAATRKVKYRSPWRAWTCPRWNFAGRCALAGGSHNSAPTDAANFLRFGKLLFVCT